jgi:hypothetical protein
MTPPDADGRYSLHFLFCAVRSPGHALLLALPCLPLAAMGRFSLGALPLEQRFALCLARPRARAGLSSWPRPAPFFARPVSNSVLNQPGSAYTFDMSHASA